eukprot:219140-Pelagomonas_calceolata.AAC.5
MPGHAWGDFNRLGKHAVMDAVWLARVKLPSVENFLLRVLQSALASAGQRISQGCGTQFLT